jgi:hypothetical protein
MPDDLYDRDILAWSEHQSSLLRRVARGERVNEVDWPHVVEEIEDVGLSELNAVRSNLKQLLIHLLKLQGWPDCTAREHWHNELDVFQDEAAERFTPAMRQRIDPAALYEKALRMVRKMRIDGAPPGNLPPACPFILDDLLTGETDRLVAGLRETP